MAVNFMTLTFWPKFVKMNAQLIVCIEAQVCILRGRIFHIVIYQKNRHWNPLPLLANTIIPWYSTPEKCCRSAIGTIGCQRKNSSVCQWNIFWSTIIKICICISQTNLENPRGFEKKTQGKKKQNILFRSHLHLFRNLNASNETISPRTDAMTTEPASPIYRDDIRISSADVLLRLNDDNVVLSISSSLMSSMLVTTGVSLSRQIQQLATGVDALEKYSLGVVSALDEKEAEIIGKTIVMISVDKTHNYWHTRIAYK